MHEEYKTNPISVMRWLHWNATTTTTSVVVQNHILTSSIRISSPKSIRSQTCSLLLLFPPPSTFAQSLTAKLLVCVVSSLLWSSPAPHTHTNSLCCFELRFCNSTCTTSNWLLCQKMHVSFSKFRDWEVKQFLPRFHFSSIRLSLSSVVCTILQRSGWFTTLNIYICTICWIFF